MLLLLKESDTQTQDMVTVVVDCPVKEEEENAIKSSGGGGSHKESVRWRA